MSNKMDCNMICNQCEEMKDICGFYKNKCFTCLKCKEEIKNKKKEQEGEKKGGRLTQEQIYHFLRDRYNVKETLKDIKKEINN